MSGEQDSSEFTESMAKDIDDILNDSMFTGRTGRQNETTPGTVNEGASTISTTPDPLNTAFINTDEGTDASVQGSQISLSQPQQQSQTTKETSSTIQGLLSRIVQQEEYPIIDLRTPTKTLVSTGTMPRTPTMASIGTMPRTPTMASTGTMPRTPTMASTGTMPRTPTMASTGTMPRTPTMASTGTMPKTPTMASTGTMPRTPSAAAMASTGTMPRTPSAAATSSVSTNDIIDLCSPSKPSTADIRTPIIETIDISSSPDTTPTRATSRPPSQ